MSIENFGRFRIKPKICRSFIVCYGRLLLRSKQRICPFANGSCFGCEPCLNRNKVVSRQKDMRWSFLHRTSFCLSNGFRHPSSSIISAIRSMGNGGWPIGWAAMLSSFVGLSSVAVRLDDQCPATAVAVDDGPLSALAHPHGDGIDQPAAVTGPIPWFDVHVETDQTVRVMIAVVTFGIRRKDLTATVFTDKHILAQMSFVESFFKLFSFLGSLVILLKILWLSSGRNAA